MYTPWLIFGGIGLIGFISLHILNIKKGFPKEDIYLCNHITIEMVPLDNRPIIKKFDRHI